MQQHRTTVLAATAAAASVASVAAVSVAYLAFSRASARRRRAQLKRDVASVISHPHSPAGYDAPASSLPESGLPRQFDDTLVREFLARNYAFFGEQGMADIRQSSVVVVGCGGVGSWAALMLLRRLPFSNFALRAQYSRSLAPASRTRLLTLNCLLGPLLDSGVSRIRLVDFDNVSLSSLNRHATAVLADVGTPKVTSTKAFFAKIAPWATVEACVELWTDTPQGHALLDGADWVIGQ